MVKLQKGKTIAEYKFETHEEATKFVDEEIRAHAFRELEAMMRSHFSSLSLTISENTATYIDGYVYDMVYDTDFKQTDIFASPSFAYEIKEEQE